MTAAELKAKLYARHPGSGGQMPGAWTVIEEWRGIDLLAFSAWSSAQKYARIGYEVKVSRSDLRRELLEPTKRARNVEWCNEFYFAIPRWMLTAEELAYVEPDWSLEDWRGERCPGYRGVLCESPWRRGRTRHTVRMPTPTTLRYDNGVQITCPTCNGKGVTVASRVEREAPTCWIPRDVGLVTVDRRGTQLVSRSPRRTDVPVLNAMELNQLVRWVSMRPDPRHVDRVRQALVNA